MWPGHVLGEEVRQVHHRRSIADADVPVSNMFFHPVVRRANMFVARRDVTEKRLQRLVKSSDLKKVGLQEGLRMCEEEIVAVEKSKAVDKIDQLERLVCIEGALADDLEQLQLHSVDLQKQLHELRMSSLDAQSALQNHEA